MISELQSKSYKKMLLELNMLSLEGHRPPYDMVQTFKIIQGFDNVENTTWFTLVGSRAKSREPGCRAPRGQSTLSSQSISDLPENLPRSVAAGTA